MSSLRAIIREFVEEHMATEAVVKRDETGQLVIRKVIDYHKPATRFRSKDVVDAEVVPSGDVVVNDVEVWEPELSAPADRAKRRARRHKALRKGTKPKAPAI